MERHCRLDNGIPVAVVREATDDTLPIEVVGFDHDPVTQIRIGPREGKLGRIYSGGQRYYRVMKDKVQEVHTVLDRRTDYILEDGTPVAFNERIHEIVDEADEHTDTEYIRTITVRVNEEKLEKAPLIIDREMGERISSRVHPEAGLYHEVAILREQLKSIMDDQKISPTDEFARYSGIVEEEKEDSEDERDSVTREAR